MPILELIGSTGVGQLLESMTDADRFLLFRRGIDVPMLPGWRIPRAAAERGMENITESNPGHAGQATRLARSTPQVAQRATPAGGDQ